MLQIRTGSDQTEKKVRTRRTAASAFPLIVRDFSLRLAPSACGVAVASQILCISTTLNKSFYDHMSTTFQFPDPLYLFISVQCLHSRAALTNTDTIVRMPVFVKHNIFRRTPGYHIFLMTPGGFCKVILRICFLTPGFPACTACN